MNIRLNMIDIEDIVILAAHIKKIRKDHNWTQGELADALGMKRQNLTKIETGQIHPRFITLLSMSRIMNVDIIEMIPESMINDPEIIKILNSKSDKLNPKAASSDKLS
ncbi:MAG: helix-turn-helix transcriptional regulator [Lachnospiraceae bacterium]|nr:helix-turn-helix transcriptional regulator [Lachnospiraceae bacterium]